MQDKVERSLYVRIAFLLSICLMIIIGYFILKYVPDNLDEEYIENTYIRDVSYFTAEKSEVMTYAFITVCFPISFIIFFKIINKIKPKANEKIIKIIDGCSIAILILLITKIFITTPYYLSRTMLYENKLLIFTILFPIFIMGIIVCQKITKGRKNRIVNYILYTFGIVFIGIASYLYINNSYAQVTYEVYHTDAYFYPIYKINSGLTPGVDFNSIYGYYSYFFSMIMSLMGTTSIFSFSCIIALLVFVTLLSLAIFTSKMIKNKFIWLMTVLSFIYIIVIQQFSLYLSGYLQYVPHRMLFPIAILVYILIYTKHKIKRNTLWQLGGGNSFFSRINVELRNRINSINCMGYVFRL